MIKQVVVCDRCGKEIPEGKKIGYVAVFQRTEPMGDFVGNNEFSDMDFCEECLCEITKFVAVKTEMPEMAKKEKLIVPAINEMLYTEANVQKKPNDARKEHKVKTDVAAVAPAQSSKRIDYGKIKALSDAGWNAAKIAEEMGMTPQAVYDAKYKIKAGKVKVCSD